MSVPTSDSVEAGYTTTEFWLTVIGAVGTLLQPILHTGLTPEQAYALATLLVIVYTVSRTIRKK